MSISAIMLLGIGLVISLRFERVQSYFGRLAADFLSRELQANISVGGLYFEPFSSLQIRQLYISDQQGDTLLHAPQMKANLDLTRFLQGRLTINEVSLKDAYFRLYVDPLGQSNLSFLIDYFAPTRPDSLRQPKITLDLHQATLQQVAFAYVNRAEVSSGNSEKSESLSIANTVDFNDIHATGISGHFSEIDFSQHLASVRIVDFSLTDKSGFQIKQLNTLAIIEPQRIELKELDLQTNRSTVRDYLHLSFADYGAFNDFINQVDIQLDLDQSHIVSSDIAYFAPDLAEILFDIQLSGSFSGRVNAIKGSGILLQAAPTTQLQGDLSIVGLPNIDHTLFDVRLDHLSTDRKAIEELVADLGRAQQIDLPELFERMGSIHFQGDFQGYYNNFNANGLVHTDLGVLDAEAHIDFSQNTPRYSGTLDTDDFDIGQLLQVAQMGKTSFSAKIDGTNFDPQTVDLQWDGQINFLGLRQYPYRHIRTNGTFRNQQLEGSADIADPNLRMRVHGQMGLADTSRRYQLEADVQYANLHALRIYPDSQAFIHHALIRSNLHGTTLNDLQGALSIEKLHAALRTKQYYIDSLALSANGLPGRRQIRVDSDLLNASLSGQVDFYTLWPYWQSLVAHYIPSLALVNQHGGVQDFAFDLQINDFSPIAAFFVPQLSVAASTSLSGHFSTDEPTNTTPGGAGVASIELLAPQLKWGTLVAGRELHLQAWADSSALTTDLRTGGIQLHQKQPFDSLHLTQRIQQDRAVYEVHLSDTTDLNEAQLSGTVLFQPERAVEIRTAPSDIRLDQAVWQVNAATFRFRDQKTSIQGLGFRNQDQRILINGVLSKAPGDQLHLLFDDFDLSTINPFLSNVNFNFSGEVNGAADINAILGQPYAVADLNVTNLAMDQLPWGDLRINADFDPDESMINLALGLRKNLHNTLSIEGQYRIDQPTDNLDLLAHFDSLDIDVLEVILKDLVSDVSGTLTGQARIRGELQNMLFTGTGSLQQAGFRVRYLNTPYHINGPLRIENSKLIFEQLALTDQRKQRGIINGDIDLRRLANPTIGVTIDANNLMVLNTTFQDNPLYFGTAYGSGQFRFRGTPDAMHIGIDARTEENTVFNIPLNTSTVLEDNEFIRFISFAPRDGEQSQSTVESNRLASGLNMNMDLQVTPGTLANIHTDLGELSGRGEGQINLRISSLGDFEMFGDYQVNSGKFTFTAQDFINKIFEIKQGGTIRWTGKPVDASIALTAFYEQRTSLSPLYDAAGRTPNEQRVLARAEMALSGNLLRPTINFNLDFPADPYVKDELQSYLSDANNVNQQALSLIVRRSFLPGSSSDFSRELNTTLLSAGTELAFNQLNNLISQSLNLNFIDLNIRSLNDASASLRFFDDRLVFTGGITDLRSQQLSDLNVFSNRVATDTELLYLIRKDGRLILRASNRLNTRHFLLNPSDEYISALGLIYRQEFYTFGEFFRRVFLFDRWKREEEEETN